MKIRKTLSFLAVLGIGIVVGLILGSRMSIPLKTGLQLTGNQDVLPLIKKVLGKDGMNSMHVNTSGPYCISHGGNNIMVADSRSKLVWFSLTDVAEGEPELVGFMDNRSRSSIHLLDRNKDSIMDAITFSADGVSVVDTNLDGNWDIKLPTKN